MYCSKCGKRTPNYSTEFRDLPDEQKCKCGSGIGNVKEGNFDVARLLPIINPSKGLTGFVDTLQTYAQSNPELVAIFGAGLIIMAAQKFINPKGGN